MLDTSRERAQPIGMASDGTFDRWRSTLRRLGRTG